MICPFCNNKMIKGNILGDRYKLKWMPEHQELTLGIWAKNAILLKQQGGLFTRPRVEAFVCHKCNKLISDL